MSGDDRRRQPPPEVDHMFTLKVDNIAFGVSEGAVKEEFAKFGEVGDVYMPRNHSTNEPRGFAFVRFLDERDAQDAMKNMEGHEFQGRALRISEALNKRPANPREHYLRRDDRDRDYRDRDYRERSRDRGRDYRDRERDRDHRRDRDRDDRYEGRDRERRRSYSRSRSR